MVHPDIYREMGLNDLEYQQIEGILGREPTLTELGMFAVMWSEHCGYKYSRPVLALFKTYREAQAQGALENAGVVPLDEKFGIVFKVESHNHPSAVEPFQGAATGVGNPVVYVGSSTGKDGIHGATFASVELGPDSESKRPNVQMGDPFLEKLLIEATLEALATGFVVGIQDMGAAGLTCSTCETAAKADNGMEIDVRKVPLREADMTPYEIMLSESQ